jgi:ABC-type transporter Mla maintaining outer membrane lipid asymmetry ATPase subunit MlaF
VGARGGLRVAFRWRIAQTECLASANEFRSAPETPAAKVLAVRELCKSYGAIVAVDRISFDVSRGEIVGLLGPNGAGKTTTINMILGVLEPDSGSIRIEGMDIATDRSRALERTNFAAVYAPPGTYVASKLDENSRTRLFQSSIPTNTPTTAPGSKQE